MSKTIRMVATAIPHGDFYSDGCLHVSVALSPQLFTRGHRVRLERDYYEVFNWPQYRHFFERAVHFQLYAFDANWNSQREPIPLLAKYEPMKKLTSEDVALKLWQQMLPADTPVSHWQKSNLPYKLAQALTSGALDERLREAIEKTIQRHLATAPAEASARALESFTMQLRELQGLQVDQLLVHPYLTAPGGSHAFQELFQELQKLQAQHKGELENLLLRLDLAEVSERNINETSEFHKRFSAYGQHPSLLRRTGWLWDYSIDKAQIEKASQQIPGLATGKYRLFIVVDRRPFDLSDINSKNPENNLDNSIFSKLNELYPKAGSNDTLLRLVQPKHVPAKKIADYAKDDQDVFWLGFLNELDVSFPLTAVELSPNPSNALDWRVAGWPGKKDTQAPVARSNSLFGQFREYVAVTNDHFRVRSRLVDRTQLLRRIETLVLAQREQQGTAPPVGASTGASLVAAASRSPPLPSLPNGQSAGYVANGITLTITNTQAILEEVLKNDPSTQRSNVLSDSAPGPVPADPTANAVIANLLTDSGIIYQHNVQNGYRVDVLALRPDKQLLARSLCRRRENYILGKQSTASDDLEGWISEPAQLGQNSSLYVDEELLHWNDWSLVTSFGQDDDPAVEGTLRIETKAVPGSLVPLRFRWKYSFGLRPVDICGNSARPIDERLDGLHGDWRGKVDAFKGFLQTGESTAELPGLVANQLPAPNPLPVTNRIQDIFTPPIVHQRVDGVHQPQLFLYANNPRSAWDKPATTDGQKVPHEHLTTLVVRSRYENGTLVAEDKADVRMLAPPRISLALLLQHGVVDKLLQKKPKKKPHPQRLINDLVQLDSVNAESEEIRRIADGDRIHYLTDPLADGFVLELNGQPYPIPLAYADGPYLTRQGKHYQQNKFYHKLRLQATLPVPFLGQDASLLLDHTPSTKPSETVLKLRPGFMQEISLSCLLPLRFAGAPTDEFFMRGITQAYGSPLSTRPNWEAAVGPPPNQEPVMLVHAVERPCLLHSFYVGNSNSKERFKLEIPGRPPHVADRAPQTTVLNFAIEFSRFPVLTSETYRLHAFTAGVVCDRRTELGYRVELRQQLVQSGIGPKRSGQHPNDPARELDVRFEGLRHTLPDTRYYRVSHDIEAISKFSAYFTDRKHHQHQYPAAPDAAAALCRYLDANGVSGYTMLAATALEKELAALPQRKAPDCPPGHQPPAPDAYSHPYDDTALAHRLFGKTPLPALLPVLSTDRPQPPTIEKIVPLLHWETDDHTPNAWRIERRCHTFRIYFEGDWYSSGWGEEVAVLFRLANKDDGLGDDWEGASFASNNVLRFSKKTAADYQEASLSPVASQLGSDPISTTSPVHSIIDDDFFRKPDGTVQKSQTVRVADLAWDKPTYASPGLGLEHLRDLELNYVCYPVQYASARQLNEMAGYTQKHDTDYWFEEGRFFVDIHCNPECLKNEYFPFLRFAIACHQPNSIQPVTKLVAKAEVKAEAKAKMKAADAASDYTSQQYCFSKVVLTDFCQPLPHRVINIQKAGKAVSVKWLAADNPTKQYRDGQYHNQLACFAEPAAPLPVPQPVNGYLEGIAFAKSDANQPSDQDEALRPYSPGSQEQGQRIIMRDIPPRDAPADFTITLPDDFLIPMHTVLVVAEYECHDNAALPRLKSGQESNPRLDPRYRLVFSYVHCFNQ